MSLHLNPLRLYKGRLCFSHGLVVELLRCTSRFWQAYVDLITINNNVRSYERELDVLLQKMHAAKVIIRREKVVIKKLRKEFKQGLKDLEDMMLNLTDIQGDDETLLYRIVRKLEQLYDSIDKTDLPENIKLPIKQNVFILIGRVSSIQTHTWNIAKAHARHFVKVDDLSIAADRVERKRIRKQAIEVGHLLDRINDLENEIKSVRQHDQASIEKIHEMLKYFHEEIKDLSEIMHEANILIRRTNLLLGEITREAEHAKLDDIIAIAKKTHKLFVDVLEKVERQSRRENIDTDQLLKRLPLPKAA